jgi:hypothetical protein
MVTVKMFGVKLSATMEPLDEYCTVRYPPRWERRPG